MRRGRGDAFRKKSDAQQAIADGFAKGPIEIVSIGTYARGTMVHGQWSGARASSARALYGVSLLIAVAAGCASASNQDDAMGGNVMAGNGCAGRGAPTEPQTPEIPRGASDVSAAFP